MLSKNSNLIKNKKCKTYTCDYCGYNTKRNSNLNVNCGKISTKDIKPNTTLSIEKQYFFVVIEKATEINTQEEIKKKAFEFIVESVTDDEIVVMETTRGTLKLKLFQL